MKVIFEFCNQSEGGKAERPERHIGFLGVCVRDGGGWGR